MKGWKKSHLGEIAKVGAGNPAPQDQSLFEQGTHPFFRTADAGRVRFGEIFEAKDHLNSRGVQKLTNFPKGTILFPKSGASTFLNHRVMLGVPGYVSSHLATIIADQKIINEKFLLYYLSTVAAQDLVQDQSYPSLNNALISGIVVTYPDLIEQRRIVALLDAAFAGLETLRANAEKNVQNARDLFDSYLSSLFTTNNNHETLLLGKIVEFRNGINFTKTSRGETLSVVGVKNFQNNFWAPLDDLDSATVDGELSNSDLLKENDLLFVRSNGNVELIGRCLLTGPVLKRITHSGFTIRARLHCESVDPQYLCFFLKSASVRRKMIDSGTGTNIKSLNQTILSNVLVPIPSLKNQKLVVDNINRVSVDIDRLTHMLNQKLAAIDNLKQSLLHRAFSGQLTAAETAGA